MRLTESGLRQLVRCLVAERMGMSNTSYEGTPELQFLRDAYDDPAMTEQDIMNLTYGECLEIVDPVIHAGHPSVVVTSRTARAAGTSVEKLRAMLQALQARPAR